MTDTEPTVEGLPKALATACSNYAEQLFYFSAKMGLPQESARNLAQNIAMLTTMATIEVVQIIIDSIKEGPEDIDFTTNNPLTVPLLQITTNREVKETPKIHLN